MGGRREGRGGGSPALASPWRSLWTVSPLAVSPVMLCLAFQADAPHGGLQEGFPGGTLAFGQPCPSRCGCAGHVCMVDKGDRADHVGEVWV